MVLRPYVDIGSERLQQVPRYFLHYSKEIFNFILQKLLQLYPCLSATECNRMSAVIDYECGLLQVEENTNFNRVLDYVFFPPGH